MTYYYYKNELYHWGIKGMRWGVRRYENPDGTLTETGKKRYGYGQDYDSDVTLKKGSTLTRFSANNKEKEEGMTYASFKENDVKEYEKYANLLKDVFGGEEYRYEFKLKEDLKMPSRKKMVDMYLDTIKNNDPNSKILRMGRAKQEKLFDKFQYDIVKRRTKTQQYLSYVQMQGCNAMMDTADMKKNKREKPIIVIDRGKTLALDAISKLG